MRAVILAASLGCGVAVAQPLNLPELAATFSGSLNASMLRAAAERVAIW